MALERERNKKEQARRKEELEREKQRLRSYYEEQRERMLQKMESERREERLQRELTADERSEREVEAARRRVQAMRHQYESEVERDWEVSQLARMIDSTYDETTLSDSELELTSTTYTETYTDEEDDDDDYDDDDVDTDSLLWTSTTGSRTAEHPPSRDRRWYRKPERSQVTDTGSSHYATAT